jgi:integrase
MTAVQRAFNWAAKAGLLKPVGGASPLAHLEKPQQGRREQIVTPEEYLRITARVRDREFTDLLTLSWETGVRPHELFTVEARYVDLPNARWVFPVRGSKGKKYQRVVYLTDAALEVTKRLMLKNPTGPMLRNTDGVPWCASSVSCRFQRLRKKLGTKYSLYAVRHTFCTFALAAGKLDAVTVAVLMGHRDTTMISRHYAHLAQRADYLRDAARRARGA